MKRSSIAFAALEVALIAAVPVLGWVGFRTVLDTTEGQAVDPELDPSEPGYEAFLEPTPTALALGVDAEGALSWLAFLSLSGVDEQGGAVVLLPPATLAPGPDGDDVVLSDLFAEDGQGPTASAAAELLGAGSGESFVLDPTRVAELLTPVAPLTMTISDDIPGFESGEVALTPDQVASLLVTKAPSETDLARFVRVEDVWRTWLAAVGASTDPNVVPGEASSGVGRFVRGLAAGATTVEAAPVRAVEPEDESSEEPSREVFQADVDALRSLVDDLVPFPVAAHPGARPRVRVLDGVGQDGVALQAARDVVRAGGQVTVIGNADRFDASTSRLVYFDAGLTEVAEAMGAELGITEVTREDGPNPNDLVDLTVVVGSDLAGAYGLSSG